MNVSPRPLSPLKSDRPQIEVLHLKKLKIGFALLAKQGVRTCNADGAATVMGTAKLINDDDDDYSEIKRV